MPIANISQLSDEEVSPTPKPLPVPKPSPKAPSVPAKKESKSKETPKAKAKSKNKAATAKAVMKKPVAQTAESDADPKDDASQKLSVKKRPASASESLVDEKPAEKQIKTSVYMYSSGNRAGIWGIKVDGSEVVRVKPREGVPAAKIQEVAEAVRNEMAKGLGKSEGIELVDMTLVYVVPKFFVCFHSLSGGNFGIS
ncbi:unnamed protein product [Durusdinium trenchii]|uniref:Uncharacterized protein n=1 Tax=Durusdinium trenchii TaxID=1381693 RepID=A0ABP0L018_9DINO